MRTISKTKFSMLTGIELAAIDAPMQVTSNKTPLGYWVPLDDWLARTGKDPELVILGDVLDQIELGMDISPEQVARWRELAGL